MSTCSTCCSSSSSSAKQTQINSPESCEGELKKKEKPKEEPKPKKEQCKERTPREIDRAARSVRLMILRRRSNSNSHTFEQPVVLDENFVRSVEKMVKDSVSNLPSIIEPPTIYRVPAHLDLPFDRQSYKSTVVCIGPFNQFIDSSSPKSPMQDHKWRCVNKLIARHQNIDESDRIRISLDRCLRAIKALEPRVRSCYSEEIGISSDDLALMMMLDGCFILHLLLNQDDEIYEVFKDLEDNQVVFGKLWIWKMVKYDLLLVDNQIPFFIVDKLFDLLRTPDDQHLNLVSLALKLFSNLQFHRIDAPSFIPTHQIHHLLHLFYLSIVPNELPVEQQPSPSTTTPDWIPCATELQEAGVKFKKRRHAHSFLDIKFSNGTLEIPPMKINDSSYKLFRNLIAFEQCYPDTQCHITAYAAFMDCIINTPRDLRLLNLNGILEDRTGVEQGATYFFKQLCYLIYHASDKNYLRSVYEEVAKYQGSKLHKWKAGLARDYLNNPWTVISVSAAGMLLILTIIQTFFTVYPYLKPNN